MSDDITVPLRKSTLNSQIKNMATFQSIIDDMNSLISQLADMNSLISQLKEKTQDPTIFVRQLPDDLIHLIGSFINMKEIRMTQARDRYARVTECEEAELSKPYHVDLWKPYAEKITKKGVYVKQYSGKVKRYNQDDPHIHSVWKKHVRCVKWSDRRWGMMMRFNYKYWGTNIHFIDIRGYDKSLKVGTKEDVELYHNSHIRFKGIAVQTCHYFLEGRYWPDATCGSSFAPV
jgi:hypothetical protein